MVGLSFYLNGGMVVNAVLKKPHPNFHWSLFVYAAALLHLHRLGLVSPSTPSIMEGEIGMFEFSLAVPQIFIFTIMTHTVCNFFSILPELAKYNKPKEVKPAAALSAFSLD